MNPIEKLIEQFLLDRKEWVKSEELCKAFEVSERQLRAVGTRPGLCSAFAISGDKGFKHISHASTTEYLRFKHRLRRHAISELVRVKKLDEARHNITRYLRKKPDFIFERDTGQGVLF